MMKPNILFVMTDQLRADALGKTGGWVRTPNLDRLAAEGMLFGGCVTNAPVCIPARVSLATGLYPHQTGVWGNMEYDLPVRSDTWMQAIRNQGYRTSIIGKTHLHRHKGDLRDRESFMHAYGFDDVNEIGGPRASMHVGSQMTDEWKKAGQWDRYIQDYEERFADKPYTAKPSVLPLELYADVYVGTKAKEYLRDYAHDQPWFCMVSFGGPHEPWDTPEPYASLYDPSEMPLPIPRTEAEGARPNGYLDFLFKDPAHSPAATPEEIAAMRANYAGNVTLIDEQIGGILEVLEARGVLDRTVILFTSDHGEMNGDHGLIYKESFLNSAVRVPLLIWTPHIRKSRHAGTVYPGLVELIDVGPTLCELAGTALHYPQCGKSLVPVLEAPESTHREDALVEIHGEAMLQTSEWKLAVNAEGAPYLLFSLQEDPTEQRNLVDLPDFRHIVEALMRRVSERRGNL
ncbi:hypothetical protein FE782_27105 [Paenibacillus antri]|uniref:Sulfatase N-terminal domain-containing protein n=1 Tax=Paenibacillus antri TaxID=2582848 RepID=A0A5R9G8P3_9BACL|nr:sulfatase-like hydrolase/transferase [Paenibacillus antri]TLS49113.1 hypothetical protein FE782_27105 [Paenibacillus antri]